MPPSDEKLALLNQHLEACETLSIEPHLRPYHLAAHVSLAGTLQEALSDTLEKLYARRPKGLVLHDAGDWKQAIASAYVYWAGFLPSPDAPPPAFERDEHRALSARIVEALSEMFTANVRTYWLASEDAEGQSLCPHGGLHQYLVLADDEGRLLVDFCWDS